MNLTTSETGVIKGEIRKDNAARIVGPKQTSSQDPLEVCDQDLMPLISVSYRHDIYPPHESLTHAPDDSDVPKTAKKDLELTNKQVGVIKRNLAGRRLGDDFVKLDGFCMYRGRTVPGFPRLRMPLEKGLEAITFVKRGFVDFFDHKHGEARVGPGDALWIAPSTSSGPVTHGHPQYHTWSEFYPLLNPRESNKIELVEFMFCCPDQAQGEGDEASKPEDATFDVLWKESQVQWHAKEQDKVGSVTSVSSITVIAGSFKGLMRNIGTTVEQDLNLKTPIPKISRISFNSSDAFGLTSISLDAESTLKLYKREKETSRTIILLNGLGVEVIDCETNASETILAPSNEYSSIVAGLSTCNTIEIKPWKAEVEQKANNSQMVEMVIVELPRLTSPDDKARFGSIIESMVKVKHDVEQAEPSLGAIEGDVWIYSKGPRECIHRHDESRFYRPMRHGTKQVPPETSA